MARFENQPNTDDLSAAILSAPGWARVGITMPDERMRERAAAALARSILDRVCGDRPSTDPNQLAFPL